MTPALPLAAASERLRKPSGRPRTPRLVEQAAAAVVAGGPRLLDVRAVSEYLGVCVRMVHELRGAGHLRPVRLPLGGDREVRRLLFDKNDVDAFVERSKERV